MGIEFLAGLGGTGTKGQVPCPTVFWEVRIGEEVKHPIDKIDGKISLK
jgi:hypothetical protein